MTSSCNSNNSVKQAVPDVKEEELLEDTTVIALKTFLDWEKLPKSQTLLLNVLLNQPNGSFPTVNDCIRCFEKNWGAILSSQQPPTRSGRFRWQQSLGSVNHAQVA